MYVKIEENMTDSNQEIDKYISEKAELGVFQVFANLDFYHQYKAKIISTIVILTFTSIIGFMLKIDIKALAIIAITLFLYDMCKYNHDYSAREKLKIIQEAIKLKKTSL